MHTKLTIFMPVSTLYILLNICFCRFQLHLAINNNHTTTMSNSKCIRYNMQRQQPRAIPRKKQMGEFTFSKLSFPSSQNFPKFNSTPSVSIPYFKSTSWQLLLFTLCSYSRNYLEINVIKKTCRKLPKVLGIHKKIDFFYRIWLPYQWDKIY